MTMFRELIFINLHYAKKNIRISKLLIFLAPRRPTFSSPTDLATSKTLLHPFIHFIDYWKFQAPVLRLSILNCNNFILKIFLSYLSFRPCQLHCDLFASGSKSVELYCNTCNTLCNTLCNSICIFPLFNFLLLTLCSLQCIFSLHLVSFSSSFLFCRLLSLL